MLRAGALQLQRSRFTSFSVGSFLLTSLLPALATCLIDIGNPSAVAQTTDDVITRQTAHLLVTPADPTVVSDEIQQFTALLSSTSNTAVEWSASAGTISASGLFTAPKVTRTETVSVTARSTVAGSVTVKFVVHPAHQLHIRTTTLPAATAGASYDVSLQARGGKPPYQWIVDSGLPSGVRMHELTGQLSGTPSHAGSFIVKVALKDSADHTASRDLRLVVDSTSANGFDGPAELPRVQLQTSMNDTPAPGQTIHVHSGGDLQEALNHANCGDTVALEAGATFKGVFYFPQKPCDSQHWIIVRTGAPDSSLTKEGTRITPCYAGDDSLPGRPAFNCTSTQNVMAKLMFNHKTGFGPVVFKSGANHYRLISLEITRSAKSELVTDLITPDNDATADHIYLDRLWVHGTAQDETTRGLYLSGMTATAVLDSYFNDFHCVAITGSCTDSQAIGGGGGNDPGGPYKIVDNFLEAAGENILFGGGAATTTPADIEIRHNHIFKPLTWMSGQPRFVGGRDGHPFIVKNNFELKNAQRVLFEGNIVEYTWGGFSQAGYALSLTPKNQAGADRANLCPSCLVSDITIRYSTISHAAAGIDIANALSDNMGMAAAGGRYSIHDITIDDINGDAYFGGGPLILVLNGWTTHILGDILINHITGFGDPIHPSLTVGNSIHNPKMSNFVYTNNLVRAGEYPVWSSGGKTNCAYSGIPKTVINTCFAPYAFVSNGLISVPRNYPPSTWPAQNYFPADPAAVQFVNYNNANGGDYHLLPSSPYKNAGLDWKDLGADIDAIQAAIANVY